MGGERPASMKLLGRKDGMELREGLGYEDGTPCWVTGTLGEVRPSSGTESGVNIHRVGSVTRPMVTISSGGQARPASP